MRLSRSASSLGDVSGLKKGNGDVSKPLNFHCDAGTKRLQREQLVNNRRQALFAASRTIMAAPLETIITRDVEKVMDNDLLLETVKYVEKLHTPDSDTRSQLTALKSAIDNVLAKNCNS